MPQGSRNLRHVGAAVLAGLLGAVGSSATAEIVIPAARARPSSVSTSADELAIRLTNGDRVVFKRSGDGYRQLGMTVAGKSYTVDLDGCQRFGPVIVDTLTLSPDDESRSAGAFTLSFRAGSQAELGFGQLPHLQISFRRGELSEPLITRKTSERASSSDRLCNWRTPREEASILADARYKDTVARGADLSTSELLNRFRTTEMFWRQREVGEFLVPRRDPAVRATLVPMLTAEDRHVRANAAYVLAKQGDPRGFDTLFAILEDRSARACGQGVAMPPCTSDRQRAADRYYAVHVLGELRDPRAIPVLAELIGDPEVGYKVPWALGQIGTAEVIAPLMVALDDPKPLTRVYAIQALQKMRARDALPKLRTLQSDLEGSNVDAQHAVGQAARTAIAELERVPEPPVHADRN